jgi:hypothetical protein
VFRHPFMPSIAPAADPGRGLIPQRTGME